MIVGFLADIHEDIDSLRLALDVLKEHQCEMIICLGDIVGFTLPFYHYIQTRNAEACITQVREHCVVSVAGNHDLYATRRIPEHTAAFEYGAHWYELDYSIRARKARNRIWLYEDNEIPPAIGSASLEYLKSLREIEQVSLGGLSCLVSHFCYPDFSGSTIFFPSEAFHLKKHFQFLRERGCVLGVSGHGHPEGCLIVDQEDFRLHPFGTIPLTREVQWIVTPCVARTSRANGCMILDTERWHVRVVPLRDARSGRQ
jgi:predicted phosphodiesterase